MERGIVFCRRERVRALLQKYKITYRQVLKQYETVIEATSKYDAKKRFYRLHPRWEIVKIELANGGGEADGAVK